MQQLNVQFKGKLTLAIKIFRNLYHKKFLHQLVSSQLDVDRLDYLTRDTFFTGVTEGTIGYDRIINMLNVKDGGLVVESKGIYSIEKFIIARRLMYWQVYLHKTVLAAMELLSNILKRAKELASKGEELFCPPLLSIFLYNRLTKKDFENEISYLTAFAAIDDYDVLSSIKVWANHEDIVLSTLCTWLVDRHLYQTQLSNEHFPATLLKEYAPLAIKKYGIAEKDVSYFVFSGKVVNDIYNAHHVRINILYPDGKVLDLTKASDHLNASVLDKKITKYFFCKPKGI
jgi:HD superfamily phosphohydrolase